MATEIDRHRNVTTLTIFDDREQAGRALAARLVRHRDKPVLLVLGMARGGMPVALPVALELGAELDVLVIRKVRAPGHPELAIGAVGPGDVCVLNDDIIAQMEIMPDELAQATRSGLPGCEPLVSSIRPNQRRAGYTTSRSGSFSSWLRYPCRACP